MRIKNINEQDEYPENYDNLNQYEKRDIEKYMNDEQETANRHYEKHITAESEDEREQYLDLYRHVQDVLIGSKNAFSLLHIKVEYNWKNDGKWHLATKSDYEKYNGLSDKCTCDQSEKVVPYSQWPTPKGGRTYSDANQLLQRRTK